MMFLLALFLTTLLPLSSAASENRPDCNWDANSNLRPENITNLDYRYYQYIGS